MMHMLGKCCLLVGLASIGIQNAIVLKKRTLCLRGFLTALEIMERELAFSLLPVAELLFQMKEGTRGVVSSFLEECEKRFRERREQRCGEIWNDVLLSARLPLTNEDMGILREVGGVLGKYDGDSQCLALQKIQLRLEEAIQMSKEESERKGKVYSTLGVTLGIFCMILL